MASGGAPAVKEIQLSSPVRLTNSESVLTRQFAVIRLKNKEAKQAALVM